MKRTRIDPMTTTRRVVDGREYIMKTTFSTTRPAAVKARELARDIKAFDERCEADEYTDTGVAWELLNDARKLLAKIGKGA